MESNTQSEAPRVVRIDVTSCRDDHTRPELPNGAEIEDSTEFVDLVRAHYGGDNAKDYPKSWKGFLEDVKHQQWVFKMMDAYSTLDAREAIWQECIRYAGQEKIRYDAWAADDWYYLGVIVTAHVEQEVPGGEPMTSEYTESLWGIESDCEDYHKEVAADLWSGVKAQLAKAGLSVDGLDEMFEDSLSSGIEETYD